MPYEKQRGKKERGITTGLHRAPRLRSGGKSDIIAAESVSRSVRRTKESQAWSTSCPGWCTISDSHEKEPRDWREGAFQEMWPCGIGCIYLNRTPGGYHHYCDIGCDVATGLEPRQRGSPPGKVQEQPAPGGHCHDRLRRR